MDVADIASIRRFAARWGARPLHVLINNAGVFNFSSGDSPESPRPSVNYIVASAVSASCIIRLVILQPASIVVSDFGSLP